MSALCQKQTFHHSFDHLIGAGEQRLRHGKAERRRCPHVQHELELCWLLERKIGRIGALQNLVHLARGTSIKFAKTCSIGHETASIHHFPCAPPALRKPYRLLSEHLFKPLDGCPWRASYCGRIPLKLKMTN